MKLPKRASIFGAIALALTVPMGASSVSAQFGLGGVLGDVGKAVGLPSLTSLTKGKPPISTNIKDAVYGDPSKDGFTPPASLQSLSNLQRGAHGSFILAAGYYTMEAQSYCLHAGTYGPGGGDGYLYAPVIGSAQNAVETILQNSYDHPEIEQRKIQLLLWAIVARAKFEDLNDDLKFVALQLLSKKQIAKLNRSALDVLGSNELASVIGGAPAPVRMVLNAEGELRRMLTIPGISYSDMERVAVLTGNAPRGEGSVDTPSGRWSKHPDGYWIRYIPSGYSHTRIQIWVEQGSPAVGATFDPALQIAVPGNTSRQRLAQSARIYSN